eukprot:TRINITY_DN6888_c0_g1_i1.p1 TRINITY_DN6888_c0_g1~~TRINITY_DN6888_c0_g1_i1.p1  ORF type:complete len:327 (-),score=66.56 TRINITY_DN6888_c0_g1_i1:112-1092(-)
MNESNLGVACSNFTPSKWSDWKCASCFCRKGEHQIVEMPMRRHRLSISTSTSPVMTNRLNKSTDASPVMTNRLNKSRDASPVRVDIIESDSTQKLKLGDDEFSLSRSTEELRFTYPEDSAVNSSTDEILDRPPLQSIMALERLKMSRRVTPDLAEVDNAEEVEKLKQRQKLVEESKKIIKEKKKVKEMLESHKLGPTTITQKSLVAKVAEEESKLKEAERKKRESEELERKERGEIIKEQEEERARQERELKAQIEKERKREQEHRKRLEDGICIQSPRDSVVSPTRKHRVSSEISDLTTRTYDISGLFKLYSLEVVRLEVCVLFL